MASSPSHAAMSEKKKILAIVLWYAHLTLLSSLLLGLHPKAICNHSRNSPGSYVLQARNNLRLAWPEILSHSEILSVFRPLPLHQKSPSSRQESVGLLVKSHQRESWFVALVWTSLRSTAHAFSRLVSCPQKCPSFSKLCKALVEELADNPRKVCQNAKGIKPVNAAFKSQAILGPTFAADLACYADRL